MCLVNLNTYLERTVTTGVCFVLVLLRYGYFDCNSGQDYQMLNILVKLGEVTSLLNILRQITFRLYSFAMNSGDFITV